VLVRDDLFTATIPPLSTPEHPPWPAPSTLYPALFGGAIAGATIAVMNGGRLGLRGRYPLMVLGVALAALVGRLLFLRTGIQVTGLYGATLAAEGVAVFLAAAPAQRRAYRAYEMRAHAPTSSLVGPGSIAVVAGWLIEAVLFVFVVGSA
jgi:hypothetical protein